MVQSCKALQRQSLCVRSAKALSKYSDMVDSLARTQRDLLEGASDEARVKLREWELPEALNVRLRCISGRIADAHEHWGRGRHIRMQSLSRCRTDVTRCGS